ncbi:MAG: hypothetical protein Fur005_22100 [Roseiflexaceae bacterium]
MNSANGILLTPRYQLLELIGHGSMGAVSRAYDRLSGREVALKQVLLPPDLPADQQQQELLILAHEFQVLASLRHPHIISVLDYGFDSQRQPFFTMDLLTHAQPIHVAGATSPLSQQIGLILQGLEALAYLHRRGVLHHDLKPENMLVIDGQVRLLDFGLAVLSSQRREHDAFGTFIYLAPEVIDGHPYTEQADLYSLGVIAYHLLIGQHPFQAETIAAYLDQVFEAPPDMAPLADRPALAAVLSQLLAKNPADRPASAHATIEALCQAIGIPSSSGNQAIRESYLQAAAFVGREHELTVLMQAFPAAQAGRGHCFLIGGESGVGKSRLLDEIRTQALVAGFQVVRGQAVEGGGLPYQLWREPLRQCMLGSELSDLEAGVLKAIIPDLESLLGRVVSDATPLIGEAGQQRLILTITDLLSRQQHPMVLLLEDLHWSSESLLPLQRLQERIERLPVVIIATYRHDEAPQLPEQIPHNTLLMLPRLSANETALLSQAMLGAIGSQPELVELLQRETEGNSFFLVEVVRALAEEAGNLSEIQRITLPRTVLAGGIQQVVRRRLAHVPSWAQAGLALAAILGRQIDLAIIRHALPDLPLEAWLQACADVAVLEINQERWRFTHDKLREGVLHDLPAIHHQQLHQQALHAIEHAHQHDLALYYADLANHAGAAADSERERHYSYLAGSQAAAQYRNTRALELLNRALQLSATDDPAALFAILRERERIYDLLGQRTLQRQDLDQLMLLAAQLERPNEQIYTAWRELEYLNAIGERSTVLAQAPVVSTQAHAAGDHILEAQIRLTWATACVPLGQYGTAYEQLELAHHQIELLDLPALEAQRLSKLGFVRLYQGQFQEARDLLSNALGLHQQLGDRRGQLPALINLSWIVHELGDWGASEQFLNRGIDIAHTIGARSEEGFLLSSLSNLMCHHYGDLDRAINLAHASLQIGKQINNYTCQIIAMANIGSFLAQDEQYAAAQPWVEQALAITQQIGEQRLEGFVQLTSGHIATEPGQFAQAEQHYATALQINRQVGNPGVVAEVQAGIARLALAQQDLPRAQHQIELVCQYIAEQQLRGIEQPILVLFTCYRILHITGDPQAPHYLHQAYEHLLQHATGIDPDRQQILFERIPLNRMIGSLFNRAMEH